MIYFLFVYINCLILNVFLFKLNNFYYENFARLSNFFKELILYNIEESLINRGFLLWKSEHHEKIYIKDAQIKDKVLSLKDIFIKNNNNKLFDDFTLKIDGKGL